MFGMMHSPPPTEASAKSEYNKLKDSAMAPAKISSDQEDSSQTQKMTKKKEKILRKALKSVKINKYELQRV